MKITWKWLLMAVVVLGLGMSVTSCKDDDDDKNTSEQKKSDVDPLDTDEARVAFRWLCALANSDGFDANWQKKTWEPMVGQASENSQYTRIVVVNDLNEAKEQFAKLADIEVGQLGKEQTVSAGAAGTMKWVQSKDGAGNLAVVDVNSKIMPHLQKLVYCTQEQTGLNSAMAGTAYYRFGDVVEDSEGYYWVCVRPSFAPKKGESHWINIYNAGLKGMNRDNKGDLQKHAMHNDYIYNKYNKQEKYKGVTINLPTKLPYDREQIYNLNNLIWALLKPNQYIAAAKQKQNTGLGGFKLDYHGENFIDAVAKYWKQVPEGYNYSIWEMLFGLSEIEIRNIQEMNFFYQGYKWWWGETPDFWIYKSTEYESAKSGSESGDKVTNINVVTSGFDIRRYTGDEDADKNAGFAAQFTKNNDGDVLKGYWVVRYKRGDQLCVKGSNYDPYNKLSGCKDVYTFNGRTGHKYGADVAQELDKDLNVKIDVNIPEVGYVLGKNGLFYKDEQTAQDDGTFAIALVVCVNNATPVETGTDYYGLAINTESLGHEEYYPWEDKQQYDKDCAGASGIVDPNHPELLPGVLNGIAVTKRMATHECNAEHLHLGIEDIYAMDRPITEAKELNKFSKWFIPSAGQAILAIKNMGYTWDGTKFTGNGQWKWNSLIFPDDSYLNNLNYMTCTASSGEEPGYYVFSDGYVKSCVIDTRSLIRTMIAFKKIQ